MGIKKHFSHLEEQLTQSEQVFFSKLKSLLQENDGYMEMPSSHYYTLLTNRSDILIPIHSFESYELYYQPEMSEYAQFYSDGSITIVSNDRNVPYLFSISLDIVGNQQSYCNCEPTDHGFDDEYDCCGIKCEGTLSSFTIRRVEIVSHSIFSGNLKLKWELEKEWNEK